MSAENRTGTLEAEPVAKGAAAERRAHGIAKVGVLGAGVMGAGIAAHVATAGLSVVLLDIVPEGAGDRNALAAGAVEKLRKARPAPLMAERNARRITPGNLEDHLELLADCDWIVEAVVERLDVKQAVYRRVDAVRKPGSIVSSNTSTIPLAKLTEGLPEGFQRDFLITHFFNPPRYMRLLELVAGERTRPEAVEAVVERLDVKQEVYRRIDAVRKPGSIVSSNTSTIPLAKLTEGLPEGFQRDFLITHFFNPPRYMRLLELVAGEGTRPDAIATLREFCDFGLGKSVVACKDTPGFIANRIGTFWIEAATNAALDLGLTVEEADAVAGRPIGFPKTGVFGLMDLVGIDLGPHIAASLLATLPPDDPYRDLHRDLPLVERMIGAGLTGRKGK
ncbi:MAG TPA: 3-hydroxyacyl-CoA dehydrogenase family protein, partial [Thermoanaerobaculia bacterium]|nr:3-hydroxyacyl-CoA dehydrogenase family protein [Thermoanaerobaculia bacterium]